MTLLQQKAAVLQTLLLQCIAVYFAVYCLGVKSQTIREQRNSLPHRFQIHQGICLHYHYSCKESIFLSWYDKILPGIPAMRKKRYFLYICSWRVRFGERRGKQDYSHQVSPEHNPSIADHTHTAELESVLSLSVLVLGFLP